MRRIVLLLRSPGANNFNSIVLRNISVTTIFPSGLFFSARKGGSYLVIEGFSWRRVRNARSVMALMANGRRTGVRRLHVRIVMKMGRTGPPKQSVIRRRFDGVPLLLSAHRAHLAGGSSSLTALPLTRSPHQRRVEARAKVRQNR